jgi:hypothetical protein
MPPDFFPVVNIAPVRGHQWRPARTRRAYAGIDPAPIAGSKEGTMDAIVDVAAQGLLLGSAALLVWGAILAVGQLLRSDREQRAAAAAARGEDRRRTPRTVFASIRRRRFSRLAPPA